MELKNILVNIYHQIDKRRKRGSLNFILGLVLAVIWQIYKRIIGKPLVIQTYKDTKFIIRPNCVTSSRFIYEGWPDEKCIKKLASYAGNETAFVDVGANVGLYTTLLCNDFRKGWLFEPNPISFILAMENLKLNGIEKKFEAFQKAVGAKKEILYLPKIDTPSPIVKIVPNFRPDTIPIEVVKLDDILPTNLYYVVKIDTEGSDVLVIEGMSKLFRLGKIKICQFECLNIKILSTLLDILSKKKIDNYIVINVNNNIIKSIKDVNLYHENLFLVRSDLIKLD